MPVTIENNTVSRCNKIKYLGVILAPELKFVEQVNSKCAIAVRNIQYISCISKIFDTRDNKAVGTFPFDFPLILDYSNVILAGILSVISHKLQCIQNWATKVVQGRSRQESSKQSSQNLHRLLIEYHDLYTEHSMA